MAAAVALAVGGAHVLVLTDYDGTLAPIAQTPDEARLTDDMRRDLDALAAVPAVSLGVVSGRRLEDVAARVGPAPEYVAGLHGLEITGPGVTFHHQALDVAEAVVARLAEEASRQLQWCPGYLLENKRYALTCHVRRTPSELREQALEEFEALAEPLLEGQILRLLRGRQAIELLPVAAWDKGRAVGWIRQRVQTAVGRPVPVVYLGDDRTDEDAFTVLLDGDAAIGVGERPHTHLIDFRLAGPDEVGEFFRELRRLLLDLSVR